MEAADAGLRINRMWERIARSLDRTAVELAKSECSLDRSKALAFGRAAEACYWQSTGDEDCHSLKDER